MATASMVRDGERMNGSVAVLSGTLCDTIMFYAFTFLSLRPLFEATRFAKCDIPSGCPS